MKNLIIINGGKFGREVYTWVRQAIEFGAEISIKGFLDDRPEILAGLPYDVPVLGSVKEYQPDAEDVFLCAIGDPRLKKAFCTEVLAKGGEFITFVHPSAVVGPQVRIGEGAILCPFTQASCEIEIGRFVTLGTFSSLGHDTVLGEWCQISGHCGINGNARIGEGAFLGSHSVILPNAKVGDWSHVGAGSVVLKKVNAYSKVFGNPAVEIGMFSDGPSSTN